MLIFVEEVIKEYMGLQYVYVFLHKLLHIRVRLNLVYSSLLRRYSLELYALCCLHNNIYPEQKSLRTSIESIVQERPNSQIRVRVCHAIVIFQFSLSLSLSRLHTLIASNLPAKGMNNELITMDTSEKASKILLFNDETSLK